MYRHLLARNITGANGFGKPGTVGAAVDETKLGGQRSRRGLCAAAARNERNTRMRMVRNLLLLDDPRRKAVRPLRRRIVDKFSGRRQYVSARFHDLSLIELFFPPSPSSPDLYLTRSCPDLQVTFVLDCP